MAKRYPYDILLAGIGIGGKHNTTLATVELLRKARIVYSLSVHGAFVRTLCPNFVDLHDVYYTGEEDEDVYARLAQKILDEAKKAPGVAMVDDGHPLLFDDVNEEIAKRGRRMGLKVVVLPSVSSIDAMMVECGLLLNPVGFQMVEATTLVLNRQQINPAFDTLVLQIGWFGTSLIVPVEGQTSERFVPLQKYLMKFFPRTHRVRIMSAPVFAKDKALNLSCKLEDVKKHYRRINSASNLFVPALDLPTDVDEDLLEQLPDKEHLARIAQVGEKYR
jgi:precorrin-6B methylase 1